MGKSTKQKLNNTQNNLDTGFEQLVTDTLKKGFDSQQEEVSKEAFKKQLFAEVTSQPGGGVRDGFKMQNLIRGLVGAVLSTAIFGLILAIPGFGTGPSMPQINLNSSTRQISSISEDIDLAFKAIDESVENDDAYLDHMIADIDQLVMEI